MGSHFKCTALYFKIISLNPRPSARCIFSSSDNPFFFDISEERKTLKIFTIAFFFLFSDIDRIGSNRLKSAQKIGEEK